MPQSRLSTPSWLSLRATCQVQNPATSLVGAGLMAAALPMPSVRKRPFADQAARALQSPTLGILFEGQPMSWSCHISNMKGFLIHHHPETFMQRHSNGHMAMSLACLKPRLQPRQANQCHIIGLANSPCGGFPWCNRRTSRFGKPALFPSTPGLSLTTVASAWKSDPAVFH
jgi:hypothetical protein